MPHSGLPKPPGPFKKLLQLILDVVSAFNPPIDAARKIWKWLKAEGAAMKRGWHLFTVLAILFAALSFWLGLLYCEYSQRSQKTIAGGTRGDLFPRVDLSPASSQNCDDKYRGDLEHEFSPITLGKLCVDAFDLQCWNSVKTLFERAKQQEPNANEADGWKEVYPLYAGALLRRDKPNDAYAALQQMTNEIGKDVELYNNHFNNPAGNKKELGTRKEILLVLQYLNTVRRKIANQEEQNFITTNFFPIVEYYSTNAIYYSGDSTNAP